MTEKTLLEACVRYRQRLEQEGITAVDHAAEVLPSLLLEREQLEHVRWMLEQLCSGAIDDREKVMRWLGFIQGVFWSCGYYTIQTMRTHNTTPAAI